MGASPNTWLCGDGGADGDDGDGDDGDNDDENGDGDDCPNQMTTSSGSQLVLIVIE